MTDDCQLTTANSLLHRSLPSFSQQWVDQWKAAGPKLQAIKDRELRELNEKANNQTSDCVTDSRVRMTHAEARNHGLAIQQSWFMRKRILDAANAS